MLLYELPPEPEPTPIVQTHNGNIEIQNQAVGMTQISLALQGACPVSTEWADLAALTIVQNRPNPGEGLLINQPHVPLDIFFESVVQINSRTFLVYCPPNCDVEAELKFERDLSRLGYQIEELFERMDLGRRLVVWVISP